MNQKPQVRPSATALVSASTPAEARELADSLLDVMSALLSIVENETALVRVGQVRDAMRLGEKKTELSYRYRSLTSYLKASQKYLEQATPELLSTLLRNHEVFRAMLQINLTVLATAHAVSEGIVRGVNAEMQRRNIPQTYTAFGKRAVPGARHIRPIAVSRSL
jgi:hypothetical protein